MELDKDDTFDFLMSVYADIGPAKPWWTRLPAYGLDGDAGRDFLDVMAEGIDKTDEDVAEVLLEWRQAVEDGHVSLKEAFGRVAELYGEAVADGLIQGFLTGIAVGLALAKRHADSS